MAAVEPESATVGGPEARLDVLITMMRSFRDAVSQRLEVFAERLDGLTVSAGQQRSATEDSLTRLDASVRELERDFSVLSNELTGISLRLNTLLGQLVDYDLRRASESLATGIDQIQRHVAESEAGLDIMRVRIEDHVRAQLDETIGATNERLSDLSTDVERLTKEVALLRRRISLTAK